MIFHKDWFMRQIEQVIDALTHLLMHTATAATIAETVEPELRESIEKGIRAGEICKTEDWLYANRAAADERWLRLAVVFYTTINQFSDEYLETHNFSRGEILSGLQDFCKFYGYPVA